MKVKELAYFMEVPQGETSVLYDLVDELAKTGALVVTKNGKLLLPERLNLYFGTFISNPRGFGFVSCDKLDGDVFIPASATNGAMHSDKVLFRIVSEGAGGRTEGEITEVVETGLKNIVGQYVKEKGHGFVMPDNKRITEDIFIKSGDSKGAVTGHKVVVRLTKKAPSPNECPEGRVVEILGHINDPGVDVLSIVRQMEIPTEFPPDVLREAAGVPDSVADEDTRGRRDYRGEETVTIDGEDAKDLDDAVSVTILESGNYMLSVHIADVCNYVKEGSPLDKEAYERGTSVYLADRVIPMLPHKLSNGICSLNAQVDRLALSCIMEIDRYGTVVSHDIFESVINVKKRMSYNAVNAALTTDDIPEGYAEYLPMLKNMEKLYGILRSKRVKRGSVDFDFPESKIVVDESGWPTDIRLHERNIATGIIEEFMIACNETVAEEYFWRESPFVYRTHEQPSQEKLMKLTDFIGGFGYSLKGGTGNPKRIQQLLAKIEGTAYEGIISRVVLRSFMQARYTPTNDGHFGLASKYYSHFTSPIRRYPDLQIHRIIKETLANGLSKERGDHFHAILPEVCRHSSVAERTAELAEREVTSLKKVQFMSGHVGEEYDGIISGVTSWGIYVELPNTVEGMVSLSAMRDDYYIYDEEQLIYVGERTRKVYRLGDNVRVRVTSANITERKLDFEFI